MIINKQALRCGDYIHEILVSLKLINIILIFILCILVVSIPYGEHYDSIIQFKLKYQTVSFRFW